MTPLRSEQHARVRSIFLDAIGQDPSQRDAFVRKASSGDPHVLAEVRSLLRHHDPRTILKLPPPEGAPGRRTPGRATGSDPGAANDPLKFPVVARAAPVWWRRNFRLVLAVLLAAGGFTALLLWTGARVRTSLQQGVGDQLEALVDAGVTGVEAWVDGQRTLVASWALDPRLVELTQALAEAKDRGEAEGGADAARAAVRAAPQVPEVRALLEPLAHLAGLRGFGLLAPDGRVLLSRGATTPPTPDLLGAVLPSHTLKAVAPVFSGHPFLLLPYDIGAAIGLAPRDAPPTDVVMSVLAPVRAPAGPGDEPGPVIAALAFQLRPERDFTRILATPRIGASGEIYAFDRQGRMISDTRFTEQLRRIGLLPDVPEARAPLAVRLVDPGVDLTVPGHAPPLPPAERPATRMAQQAIAGLDGVDVRGYRDYRGVEVVGAWRWLEADGFGVAAEMDREEAFAALAFPRRTLVALLFALAAALLALLAFAIAVARLRHSVREVRRLGQYTLEKLLGEGGMGRVYRARHALLSRATAVKLLRPDRVDEATLARFEREVQLTTRLSHPNTIEIYDYGRTAEGLFYYAMEHLEGGTLEDLVAIEGALPASRVIHILRQVCLSLREAHALGLLHRDIKPMNIFLCERGGEADFVKVLDFGLAKDLHAGAGEGATASLGVLGTPLYIAPERLHADARSDARSDLYAVGAVAFKLLTGQDLFPGESVYEICAHTLHDTPRRPSTLTPLPLPEDLDLLVMELLSKKPEHRPASAQAVLDLLDSVRGLSPWTPEDARRWWRERGGELRTMRELARGLPARVEEAADEGVGPLGIEPRTNGL